MKGRKPQKQDQQKVKVAALATAHKIATKVFGQKPSPDVVFSVFDNLPVEEEEHGAYVEELIISRDVAAEIFGADVSADAALGVFECLFDDEEDDDYED